MNANFVKTLAVLLALIIAPQQGLSFEPRTLDAAQMQRDLRFLQTKLNTIHPEPYHHLNKDQFDAMVNRLDANLAPMSSKEWYVKLADLVSSLHDGHTAVFYNQDERQQYFNEGGTILPFLAEVKDDESVIVGHHFTDDAALSGERSSRLTDNQSTKSCDACARSPSANQFYSGTDRFRDRLVGCTGFYTGIPTRSH